MTWARQFPAVPNEGCSLQWPATSQYSQHLGDGHMGPEEGIWEKHYNTHPPPLLFDISIEAVL